MAARSDFYGRSEANGREWPRCEWWPPVISMAEDARAQRCHVPARLSGWVALGRPTTGGWNLVEYIVWSTQKSLIYTVHPSDHLESLLFLADYYRN